MLSILTDNGNEFQSFMTEDEHSRQQPFSGIRHLGYVQIKLDWTRTWQLSIRRSQATVGVELSPHMVTHEPAMLAQGCSTLLSPPFPPMYRFLVHFTTFIHLYRADLTCKEPPRSASSCLSAGEGNTPVLAISSHSKRLVLRRHYHNRAGMRQD